MMKTSGPSRGRFFGDPGWLLAAACVVGCSSPTGDGGQPVVGANPSSLATSPESSGTTQGPTVPNDGVVGESTVAPRGGDGGQGTAGLSAATTRPSNDAPDPSSSAGGTSGVEPGRGGSLGESGGAGGAAGAGASTAGSAGSSNGGDGGGAAEPYDFAAVQQFMLTWNCRGCHEGSDGPSPEYPRDAAELHALFTSYTVDECGDAGQTLVVPGNPDDSALVSVLEGKCDPEIPRMPPMEFGPTPEEVAGVRGWVEVGALP